MATKKRPAGKTGSSTSRSRQSRQGQSSTPTAAPRNDSAELLQASLPGTATPQPAPEAAEAPAVTPVVAEEAAPEQPKECAAAAPEVQAGCPEETMKEEAVPAEEPEQAPA